MNSRQFAEKEMTAKVFGDASNSEGEGGVSARGRLRGGSVNQRGLLLPLILAILAIASGESLAEGGRWVPTGGPTGGPIRHLVQDPGNPDVVYAIGEIVKGGVWKSSDGGRRWAPWSWRHEDSLLADMVVDPHDSNVVYKATFYGLFRTQDAGISWQSVRPSPFVRDPLHISLHDGSPGLVYAYMEEIPGWGVWRSEDGGDNWTPPGEELDGGVTAMVVAPDDPSTLLVGTRGGRILRSLDAAASWSPVGLQQPTQVRALAIDPTDPTVIYAAFSRGLFRSADRGDAWTGVGFEEEELTGVSVASDGSVFALTRTELYRSVDRGDNWSPMQLNQGLTDLVVDWREDGWILAATSSGVFRLESAESWVPSNEALANAPLFSLAVHPASPETFFAGGAGAVFRSADRGASWLRFPIPVDPSSPSTSNVHRLVIDPHHNDTLYAGTFQGVFRSRDGGVDWEPANSGLENLHVRELLVDPNQPGRLYAAMGEQLFTGGFFFGTAGGVFTSDDGGNSWTAGGLQGSFVQCLAVDPADGTVYSNRRKSEDGGLTFTEFDNEQHPWPSQGCSSLQFPPSQPDVLYLTNVGGVFRSEDRGLTWIALSSAGFPIDRNFLGHLVIAPDDPETMVVATDHGVYQTRNDGRAWFPITGGLPRQRFECVAADPSDSLSVFACPRLGGLAHYTSILPGPENLRHPAFSSILTAGDEFTGVAVTNLGVEAADVQLTGLGADGQLSPGDTADNPVLIQLAPGERRAFLAREAFSGADGGEAARWFRVDSSSPDVVALQSLGKFDLTALAGSALGFLGLDDFTLTEIISDGSTVLQFANPNPHEVQGGILVYSAQGQWRSDPILFEIPPFGVVGKDLSEFLGGAEFEDTDVLIGGSTERIIPLGLIRFEDGDFTTVPFLDRSEGFTTLIAPHYAITDAFVTEFSLMNLDDFCEISASVNLKLFRDDGVRAGTGHVQVPCWRRVVIDDPELFGSSVANGFSGYVVIESSRPIGGTVRYRGADGSPFLAVLPLTASLANELILNHLVAGGGDFMGIAIVNPGEHESEIRVEAFAPSGELIASGAKILLPGERSARLLTEHLPELSGVQLLGGYVKISSDEEIAASALYAPSRLTSLMPVPAQALSDQ
jgi:photosystem II stability/assembly factor-like uncharacterized protein